MSDGNINSHKPVIFFLITYNLVYASCKPSCDQSCENCCDGKLTRPLVTIVTRYNMVMWRFCALLSNSNMNLNAKKIIIKKNWANPNPDNLVNHHFILHVNVG